MWLLLQVLIHLWSRNHKESETQDHQRNTVNFQWLTWNRYTQIAWQRIQNNFSFFKRLYLFIFREGRREGEREGEKHQCVCFLHACYWGPGPQCRCVPWLGIKSATFWFTGQCSTHWATPTRAKIIFLKILRELEKNTDGQLNNTRKTIQKQNEKFNIEVENDKINTNYGAKQYIDWTEEFDRESNSWLGQAKF